MNYHETQFNNNRICDTCQETKLNQQNFCVKNMTSEKSERKREFENFIKNCKDKEEYDCLLMFSGGKDSAYLLHLLKQKYKLNVLALTIDTGLLQPIVKSNIKRIINKIDVDHIYFKPKNDFYIRLYRYFLIHQGKNEMINITICSVCQKVMYSIALKMAVQKRIPFIALAFSPDQEIFLKDKLFSENPNIYRMPEEKLLKNWTPNELYHKPFLPNDRNYFWNPEELNVKDIPAFFCPFYVIDYPPISEIYKKLSNLGLGSKRNYISHKTECYLAWLLAYLDLNLNYNLIPNNKALADRSGTSELFNRIGKWLLKNGIVKRKDIFHSLEYLNLKIEDILDANKNHELK